MEHGLHVLVRLDMDQTSARIEVSGCVTDASWESLIPIIERTDALTGGLPVTVDLHPAGHIDRPALEQLERFYSLQGLQNGGLGEGAEETVNISSPKVLPQCLSEADMPSASVAS